VGEKDTQAMFGLNNNRKRFVSLITPHIPKLGRLASRLCNSSHDAEDLIQELLTRLYCKTDQMEQQAGLGAWLAKCLYNLFVDEWRQKQKSPLLPLTQFSTDSPIQQYEQFQHPVEQQPEQLLYRTQQQLVIQACLESLSDEHRILITLHDIEGYTLPELSVIVGIPIGTAKSRLHRSRQKLRSLLSAHGIIHDTLNNDHITTYSFGAYHELPVHSE